MLTCLTWGNYCRISWTLQREIVCCLLHMQTATLRQLQLGVKRNQGTLPKPEVGHYLPSINIVFWLGNEIGERCTKSTSKVGNLASSATWAGLQQWCLAEWFFFFFFSLFDLGVLGLQQVLAEGVLAAWSCSRSHCPHRAEV